jgi:aspartokinase/homoserine dehydrogenase 1
MIVAKFGGSSLASAEAISQVRNICQSLFRDKEGIVVVSAVGGITDLLTEAGTQAATGNEAYLELLSEIEKRHVEICKKLFPPENQSQVLTQIKLYQNSLEDICKGVFLVRELTAKTRDYILGFGERLSSTIVFNYFDQDIPGAGLIDPTSLIRTDENFGNANVDVKVTDENIRTSVVNIQGTNICPGFIAGSHSGNQTTLGRGGSDYTAAIMAGALEAEELQIWTDVDGMMTADPRFVSSAHPIEQISYEEALELSHFGAKVIYPPTIQPALKKNIPIHIKNTFNPESNGTRITENDQDQTTLIKGLSSIQNISLFNLKGAGMVGIPNFSNRLFGALSKSEVNVILITQASSEHTICVGIAETDLARSVAAINEEFEMEMIVGKIDKLETESSLSIIALVGSNMHHHVGVSGKMFSTLGENGVNVTAIAQGSSERNISAVIATRDLKKALNILHESFFLSERKRVNLFIIGVGNVGGTLLAMIENQQSTLLNEYHIDVRVIGIANSRKMHFDPDGIPLANWSDLIADGEKMDKDAFLDKMYGLNMRSSIFIDNTASDDIPQLYQTILGNNVSIVTPNKVACSANQETYDELKRISRKFNSRFLFETNVGAGLPVISTLNDLIQSGDRIKKIEAVLSGSLNFIFNNYDGTRSFKEIVKIAEVEGYTEPDPRVDLSGKDVMRKILILIREAGMQMEIEEIENEDFIPRPCMEADSIEEFYQLLESNESVFQELLNGAQAENKRIKFVARYDEGKAVTGLGFYDRDHPFYNLEGKDNIVLFTTDRYSEQPLVIKGAGAGAEVTASGIFADVIRIANT